MNDVNAGGWVPSAVPILPLTLSEIGVCWVFESAFGLNPPLSVRIRFPARTTVGFSAYAIPATESATSAPMASINIKCLRISLYLSFVAASP
jgi:hypothetical protein